MIRTGKSLIAAMGVLAVLDLIAPVLALRVTGSAKPLGAGHGAHGGLRSLDPGRHVRLLAGRPLAPPGDLCDSGPRRG